MKTFLLVGLVACSLVVMAGQTKDEQPVYKIRELPNTPFTRDRPVTIRSDRQTIDGSIVHYNGHVEMRTDAMFLHADELDFHIDTREAEAHGTVTAKVLPVTPQMSPLDH